MADWGSAARILGLSNVLETGRVDEPDRIVIEAEAVDAVFVEHRCEDPALAPRLVRDGYRSGPRREILDTPHAGRPVTIAYRQALARCQSCQKRSISEVVPHLHPYRFMTTRLHDLIGLEAIRETHASVGRRYGVSEKTVSEVFGDMSAVALAGRPVRLPAVLGLDFTKLGQGRRIGVLADLQMRTVVDLVDGGMRGLKDFLRELDTLEGVEAICTDLEPGWIGLHRQFFPSARHIADKWHVMARAGHAVDNLVYAAARRARPELKYRYRTQVLRLLRHRADSRVMQAAGGEWLDELSRTDPDLFKAYWAKEDFFAMYDWCLDPAEAAEYYGDWRKKLDGLPNEVGATLKRICVLGPDWEPAVFAYFGTDYNNAYVESVNGIIKELHRAGRRYSFDVLRAKLRLVHAEETEQEDDDGDEDGEGSIGSLADADVT